MDTTDATEKEEKPFSVLEKFRKLKKEKEQAPHTTEVSIKVEDTTSSTVFQASGSTAISPEIECGRGRFRGRGFGRFGRPRGKRSFYDNSIERPAKRIAADFSHGQKESDVGITEFLRHGDGFDVILKHRYTDFHVNEIDLDGNITKLTSVEIPKDKENRSTEEDPALLSQEQWSTLKEIVEKQLTTSIEKDVTDMSKEERQRIHKAVKRRFGVHLYSNTNVVNGRKIMKIGYGSSEITIRWPDDRPEYLHFVLHKENCETSEAVQVMSRYLRVKHNKFGYAGTKDKRAVTTQQMCLRRVEADRFKGCSHWRALTVGNFCYKWNNLRLGDLSGNRFKLALRNVKAGDEVIAEAVNSLKDTGFINYFGMQRFGQSALVPTYLVGQAILKGDWKLATELILKPRPGESTYWDVKEAREIWWEKRDAYEALKCFLRKDKSIEGKILCGLKKHGPNAYQNAFDSLPRHTVTLYLHSYQSLVWNKIVSRRVRQFGIKVLPGDLVRTVTGPEMDQLAYRWQENAAESETSEDESDKEDTGKDRGKIQVRALTAEEAESASIYDVVYPLPGDDIRYPDNEIAGWYKKMLEADGHSLSAFGKVNKKYGMYGSYRKMLETVDDLKWYIQRYSDPDEDLIQSDVDIYNRKPPLTLDPDGPYKAIIIEFNLKTCCYATMAIRELAKCETSVACQAKLTNQAREEDVASKKLKKEEPENMEGTEQISTSGEIHQTNIKMEVDSEYNENCESTQDDDEEKPNLVPSNLLSEEQSNGDLGVRDSSDLNNGKECIS